LLIILINKSVVATVVGSRDDSAWVRLGNAGHGQLSDGSHGNWVTKDDPLSSLAESSDDTYRTWRWASCELCAWDIFRILADRIAVRYDRLLAFVGRSVCLSVTLCIVDVSYIPSVW